MRKLSVVTSLFDKLALVYRSVDCLGNIQGKKIWMFFIWQTPSGAPMESQQQRKKTADFLHPIRTKAISGTFNRLADT